jgi:N-acylneuraminate cytidylyltransferase
MANLCIIPARGGSKRIPRKNIRPFLGKPIIAYAIETALTSGLFEEVMVSTDDQEIAEIARLYGAKVPFLRSSDNANDYASTRDVLLEVLGGYSSLNKSFEYICCLYPTSPLVRIEDLVRGYQLLQLGEFESVLPVVSFSYPIQRSLILEEGAIRMAQPEFAQSRSQDLPKRYHDAGQWYWIRPTSLIAYPSLFTPHSGAIELEEIAVQDIDNEIDWKLAELKYGLQIQSIS